LSTVLHYLEIPQLTISRTLRHSIKCSNSVAGRHYIKPCVERMRAALEKSRSEVQAIEKKGRPAEPLSLLAL
jgi:hypothetical protein